MKTGRTIITCVVAWALAILPEAMTMSEQSGGKIKQPVVLTDLQGEGLVR